MCHRNRRAESCTRNGAPVTSNSERRLVPLKAALTLSRCLCLQDWHDRRQQSVDAEQFHFEHQRRVRRDDAAGAARPVRKRRWDDQLARAADLHSFHTFVPAFDHAPRSERELKRVVAIFARVEFFAVSEPAGVVHSHRLTGRRGCAIADGKFFDDEPARTLLFRHDEPSKKDCDRAHCSGFVRHHTLTLKPQSAWPGLWLLHVQPESIPCVGRPLTLPARSSSQLCLRAETARRCLSKRALGLTPRCLLPNTRCCPP